jgi:hypothetical protein
MVNLLCYSVLDSFIHSGKNNFIHSFCQRNPKVVVVVVCFYYSIYCISTPQNVSYYIFFNFLWQQA